MADQPSAVSGAFRRPFPEQVAFFRQKLRHLVPTARWDDLLGAQHDTAFMVAGAMKADLLTDLAVAVDRAIAQGTSLETFRRDFAAAVERHDWHGWTGEDSKGGRAWRTRTIYRTNASVSYAAGRLAQLKAANWPLWVYRHGGSRDPRHEHLHVFDGLVLPPDHPFWEKHFPPSDWGCSCYVVGARSARGARRLGGDPDKRLPADWDAIDPKTGEPAGIGKGWGYAPGATVAATIADKVRAWEGPIAAAFLDGLPSALAMRIGQVGATTDTPPPITSITQLTTEEHNAFYAYTDKEYIPINWHLRNEGKLVPSAEPLDAVLARSVFDEDVILYRGQKFEAAEQIREADPPPGSLFIDPGFASMSRNLRKAEQFRAADPRGVLMVIRVKGRIRALDITALSKYREESEILLQRGTPVRVVRWDAEKRVLEVEIDGQA